MSIILATATAQNKEAYAYAGKLLNKARADQLQRPRSETAVALINGHLFTFKINLAATATGDKVLVIQQYGAGFVVHPQVEESYYDLAYPQSASVQLYNMGGSYFAANDPSTQQFGNHYWVGTVLNKEEILSFHGPTNFQVGADSSIDQVGISELLAPGIYTPFGESIYKKGKRLFAGLPADNAKILSAAYVMDGAATPLKWLVLAVMTYVPASPVGVTISEEPIVAAATGSFGLQLYFSNDTDANLNLISATQSGFATSAAPVWRVLDLGITFDRPPSRAAVFSTDGLTLHVEQRVFALTAGDGSFTCSENTATAQSTIGGSQTDNHPAYTVETYGVKEFWLDGTTTITGTQFLENNLPGATSAFGIGSGSFSSETLTTRAVAALVDVGTEAVAAPGGRGLGRFVFSGDANVFMEIARYAPLIMSGHGVRSEIKPANVQIKFKGSSVVQVEYNGVGGQPTTPRGSNAVLPVKGRMVFDGSAGVTTMLARRGNFVFKGESTIERSIPQTLTFTGSGIFIVDGTTTLYPQSSNPSGKPITITLNQIHNSLSQNGATFTGLEATGFGTRYPLDSLPTITFDQAASDDGVYLAGQYVYHVTVAKGHLYKYLVAPLSIPYGTHWLSELSVELRRAGLVQPAIIPATQGFTVNNVPLEVGSDIFTPGTYTVRGGATISVSDGYDFSAPEAQFGSDIKTVVGSKAPLPFEFAGYIGVADGVPITLEDIAFIGINPLQFVNGETLETSDLVGSGLVYELWSLDEFGSLLDELPSITEQGSYAVFVSGYTSNNYDITSPQGSIILTAAPAVISFTNANKPWDNNTALTPTASVTVDGLSRPDLIPYVLFESSHSDVGVYSVRAYLDHPTYGGEYTGSFTVRPKAVVFSNLSMTYTGSPINIPASITPNTVGYSITYGDGSAPTDARTTPYGATLTISHNGYFAQYNASITILKAPSSVDLSLGNTSLTYGQLWSATSPSASVPTHRTDLYGPLANFLTYTPALNTVATATGFLRVDYTSPNPNYENSYDVVGVIVGGKPVTITWNIPSVVPFGFVIPVPIVTNASGAVVAGTFTSAPAVGTTMTTPGAFTALGRFQPASNEYAATPISKSFTVSTPTLVGTWTTLWFGVTYTSVITTMGATGGDVTQYSPYTIPPYTPLYDTYTYNPATRVISPIWAHIGQGNGVFSADYKTITYGSQVWYKQ